MFFNQRGKYRTKKPISKISNSKEGSDSKLDKTGDGTSQLEDRSIKTNTQTKTEREKELKRVSDRSSDIMKGLTCVIQVPEREKENRVEERMAENFPKQIKYQITNYSRSFAKPSWLITKRERERERGYIKRKSEKQ